MRTIERNYRKNPHTANWLMTFHTAGGTNLGGAVTEVADDAAALALEAAQDDDLLNLIPEDKVVDHRSAAQANYMETLVSQIEQLDTEDGRKAREYTEGMTEHGKWTPGREGNASAWIGRMIVKRDALRATATKTQREQDRKAPAAPEVADGRYAVEEGGVLKFFKVKNGRYGRVFLDIQASEEWHAIQRFDRQRAILATIAADPKAAMIRYGHELGECGRCGRTLTDDASRAAGIGPICASK